jgi:hypothetical protein
VRERERVGGGEQLLSHISFPNCVVQTEIKFISSKCKDIQSCEHFLLPDGVFVQAAFRKEKMLKLLNTRQSNNTERARYLSETLLRLLLMLSDDFAVEIIYEYIRCHVTGSCVRKTVSENVDDHKDKSITVIGSSDISSSSFVEITFVEDISFASVSVSFRERLFLFSKSKTYRIQRVLTMV